MWRLDPLSAAKRRLWHSARGYGGQLLVVAPALDLVIVHLTQVHLENDQTSELLERIMAAAPRPR